MSIHEDEFLSAFIEESFEHLQAIESGLLSLERRGPNFDVEQINTLFRAAHSIKGGAGFVGLENVKNLAHQIENLIGLFREKEIIPDDRIIDTLLKASDTIKKLLKNPRDSSHENISEHIDALNHIYSKHRSIHKKEPPEESGDNTVWITSPDKTLTFRVEKAHISRIKAENKFMYLIQAYSKGPEDKTGDMDGQFREKWESYGDILALKRISEHHDGGDPENHSGHEVLAFIFASVLKAEDVSLLLHAASDRLFVIFEDLKSHPVDFGENILTNAVEQEPTHETDLPSEEKEIPPDKAPVDDRSEISDRDSPPLFSEISAQSSLRVKLELLDSIMALAGELVLTRNQLLQAQSSRDHKAAEMIGQRLDLVTSELREAIMQTRMQPMGIVFGKFPRMVRDFAARSGKEIQLSIEGRSVEVDKTLIEALNDPMTHLARNALDHGIEMPDERKRAGKRKAGRVFLKAYHEAGQVKIEISDDGRGIDGKRLAALAVEKGFITAQRAAMMSDDEKISLIMLPGLSTAKYVTDVSGRGVGMDVVKTNLESLGGQIAIFSKPGKGTTIKIKLPLTLAIIPCQVVETEGERFAIPQMNLEELVRIPADKVKKRVERVGQAVVLRLRDKLLPMVRLSSVLDIPRTYIDPADNRRKPDRRISLADRRSPVIPDRETIRNLPETPPLAANTRLRERTGEDRRFRAVSALNIAVVGAGRILYGLVVDRMLDPEEIVVKPLGRHLNKCAYYSGATIMGDGRVALILDIGNLARLAELASVDVSSRAFELSRQKSLETDTNLIVLFRGGQDERFALPLAHVVRVERLIESDIDRLGHRKVIRHADEAIPLFCLDQILDASPLPESGKRYVIFLYFASRQIGLLAAGPVEVTQFDASIDYQTLKNHAVMGNLIIDGKTTLLLDGFELVHILEPGWFSGKDTFPIPEQTPKQTILFAEDSKFFRSRVKSFMEEAGYRVAEAEDGLAALQILNEKADEISLVVTDIAMPNMNGFELTEKIRENEKLAHLPVIALTTLGADDDIARGLEAGVNDYQIKLDREKLMEAIRRILRDVE